MEEGGKVYACRFALQALYGHGEPSLIPGIRPIGGNSPEVWPAPALAARHP